MPRSLTKLILALTLGTTACSIHVSTEDDPSIAVVIETPSHIDWRRTIAGVEIAGSGVEPNRVELALLGAALSELPLRLVERSQVRTIYRVISDPDQGEGEALAFARGPDIYLTDRTFEVIHGRFEMAEILAHELTHTAQFAALTQADLAAISDVGEMNAYSITEFVGKFARDTGWSDSGSTDDPKWHLPDSSNTTAYGATLPSEDMAESVSLVVLGRAELLSNSRVEWVENFLDLTAKEMAYGKPYLPPGSVLIAPDTPLYDKDRAAQLSPDLIEPHSWVLPHESLDAESLARKVQKELNQRNLTGTMQRFDDAAVARFTGEFVRKDGVRFLVELWDFRDAPGFQDPPEQPVLTYVALWKLNP